MKLSFDEMFRILKRKAVSGEIYIGVTTMFVRFDRAREEGQNIICVVMILDVISYQLNFYEKIQA